MSQHPNLNSAVRSVHQSIEAGGDLPESVHRAALEYGLPENMILREYTERRHRAGQ